MMADARATLWGSRAERGGWRNGAVDRTESSPILRAPSAVPGGHRLPPLPTKNSPLHLEI